MIKDRNGEIVVTNEKQNILLKKLYGTVCGRVILKALTAPAVSKAAGAFMDSRLSVPLIKRFIKSSGIDTSQYVMKKFRSYNEFFTRRVKRGMRPIDRMSSSIRIMSSCTSKTIVEPPNSNFPFSSPRTTSAAPWRFTILPTIIAPTSTCTTSPKFSVCSTVYSRQLRLYML